jgi:hypothetical protein
MLAEATNRFAETQNLQRAVFFTAKPEWTGETWEAPFAVIGWADGMASEGKLDIPVGECREYELVEVSG